MGWRLVKTPDVAAPGFWRDYRAALLSALCRQGLLTDGQAGQLQGEETLSPQQPHRQQEKEQNPHAG